MQVFSNKAPGETKTYTAAFAYLMAAGETIITAEVTPVVHESTKAADPSPSGIIAGSCQVNEMPIQIKGRTVPVGQAILQSVTAGVENCTYAISFKATLSTGEVIIEFVLLTVSKYVPTP